MVFVKVRETYDLHTTKNKMTVIGIHTPKPDIIKRAYPGLLMQCRAYRPVSADVRLACASMLPLDPQGVGLAEGDVAPEDIFNPILYKAMSNKGMSQLEARINNLDHETSTTDILGQTADVDVDDVTNQTDEFSIYYALLSNTHDWKHANPQAGLSMNRLKPLVYEMVYNVGDSGGQVISGNPIYDGAPGKDGNYTNLPIYGVIGKAKEFPFLNTTSYTYTSSDANSGSASGFKHANAVGNATQNVPYMLVYCGCIIVPPSRLHELFYRMVVEWTIEFSGIRPLQEIANWAGLQDVGVTSHYQNYSYEATKQAITGSSDTILDSDSCMVSANVDVNKVM